MLRSQQGNNNAYCQDNELSWVDWGLAGKNRDMLEFVRKAIEFRKTYTVLRGRHFFNGTAGDNRETDIAWYGPDLQPLDWKNRESRTICYLIDGGGEPYPAGSYQLFFVLNADASGKSIRLPEKAGRRWFRVVDTGCDSPEDFLDPATSPALHSGTYLVRADTAAVFICKHEPAGAGTLKAQSR
jgi:glycogen operon protein